MSKQKIYLLDTNVLLHNPRSIFSFENVLIVIPAIALEQLDQFKREATERGRSSREVIRYLDELRQKGSLGEGIKLDNGSVLKVVFYKPCAVKMPFDTRIEDNEILSIAMCLKEEGNDVEFISKDLNARVKADILGIPTQDYLKDYVSQDEFYKGWLTLQVPSVELKKNIPNALQDLVSAGKLSVNEFILVESQHNPFNYRIFRYLGGTRFKPVENPSLQWPIHPRNAQQLMALDLLLDDEIQLVSLLGPAGTGKTFITLVAGLHKVLVENVYKKMLLARPIVPLGKDVGYLPGTLQEKLYSWMLPVYDNMELIMHSSGLDKQYQGHDPSSPFGSPHDERDRGQDGHYGSRYQEKRGGSGPQKRRGGDARDRRSYERSERFHERQNHGSSGTHSLDELVRRDKISLEAITYMRGRSIPYQFIFIDEVQNLTPHEVKTLVSRVGEGSKIVIAGDPYQIDSPYLDFSSNGLVITGEKFKGQPLFGTVYMEKSERSALSQLASDLL